MADIKGIELASNIYGLEDETARDNTETNTSAIAAIQNVIPEDASVDNKLVTRKSMLANNAGAHNSIYRGKYLGSSVTPAQYAQISAGTFEDLFIGDYWTIDGVNYRIAHFDYWRRSGDLECTKHHIIVVPDSNFASQKMNDTDTTEGGYVGSKMYTTYLATARNTIITAFGASHILSHRELFTKEVAGGKATNWDWYDSTIDLMSECMVYGNNAWSSALGLETGIDKSQLALFNLMPEFVTNRALWWLRNVASATSFVVVSTGGNCAVRNASNTGIGVRPVLAICAA